jgi:diketogulonate reductase-like aldo/keto reductase
VQTRRFGPLDVEVPRLGLGTWQMELGDREATIRAMHRGFELGITHVDTAEIYGDGAVEELVSEALVGHRGDVFLASKVNPEKASYAGTLLACEKTLRRLRTDHLDLYMLHWRGKQPLEPSLRALEALVEEGKIRAWGVSNFDVADLEQAIEIAGEGAIACNQVLYNLDERDAEHMLQLFCERHRIAFVAYSPLGAGAFPAAGSFRGDVLRAVAAAHGVTAHAVALAFLLRRPETFAIAKASQIDHVEQLARAGDLALTADELRAIDQAFPLDAPKSKLPYS